MKQYLRVYKALLKINFARLTQYRATFISAIIITSSWAGVQILTMWLLSQRVSNINGWTRNELLLMAGSYSIIISTFHMLFARNFALFSQLVHQGELDNLILKPLNDQFLVSLWRFNYPNLFRIALGITYVCYIISVAGFHITFINILSFLVLMGFSIMLLYAIWFLFSTITIWFSHLYNMPDLLYNITGVTRFPTEVYSELKFYIFAFLLPLSLVVSVPVKGLIGQVLAGNVALLIIISIGLFYCSRLFWKFALRSYTSASS